MKYTKQIDDYYSIRIIKSIFKIAWVIVGTTTNIIWWSFSKLPKSISLLLIPLGVIFASGVVTPVVSNEEAVIIYDIPTPTEQRLKDLEGTIWSREDIDWYVGLSSEENQVDPELVHALIKCESNYVQDIRAKAILSYGLEDSWGLSQIHLPSHPAVTREEAINPQYAIDFMTTHISRGYVGWWMCSELI